MKTQPIENFKKQVRTRVKEDDIQRDIIAALRVLGFTVLETSEHRRRETCPKCGHSHAMRKGRGCSKGVADLLVTRDDFPPWVYIGLEVKGPKTPLSPEQAELARCNRIVVVRSAQEALDAVHRAAQELR
jgi:hypothetical protein